MQANAFAPQMWNLNPNGTLVNSYSGLCATMNSVTGDKSETLFFIVD